MNKEETRAIVARSFPLKRHGKIVRYSESQKPVMMRRFDVSAGFLSIMMIAIVGLLFIALTSLNDVDTIGNARSGIATITKSNVPIVCMPFELYEEKTNCEPEVEVLKELE